jgi:hypothetical protein
MLGTEQGVVDDITASGGLRATPTPEDLKQFVEAASNLDGLKIAELMMGKLVSGAAGAGAQPTYLLYASNVGAL